MKVLSRARLHMGEFLPGDESLKRLKLLRLFIGITFVLGILAVIDQRQYADEIAVWSVSRNWRWAIRIGWTLVGLIGIIFISTWTSVRRAFFKFLDLGAGLTAKLGPLRGLLVTGLSIIFPLLVLGAYGRFVLPFFTRLLIFWLLVSFGSWFVLSVRPLESPIYISAALALIFGAVHRVAVFSADLSIYPFSLGWSEASRYYYASLFFPEKIYGVSIPPSVLHPTRYLMQSIPFLVPGSGLFVHRLWQVIVWVLMTAAVGIVLARRIRLQVGWVRWLFVIWIFLFLFQGPIWYHLLAMVVVTVWRIRTDRPWKTLGVVILASLWAGISRVNWIPVPGMLAVLLYFLERKKADHSLVRYSAGPVVWFVAGTASGFLGQWLYILVSGSEASRFVSSLSSPLLWYRLLPSGTYPLGVLPAIALASIPLVLLIGSHLMRQPEKMHPVRMTGVIGILAVLFSGGILVSVKIGGGSNLHNLDAFLTTLLIAGVYAAFSRGQFSSSNTEQELLNPPLLIMFVIWMPVFFAIGMGKPLRSYALDQAQRSLNQVRSIVEPVISRGGDILFISQRHLLTFGNIEDIEVIPEYETVFLMEMAMSHNREYLDRFHADLRNQRFEMIVVDRLSTQIQSRDHNFAEENNAWVEEVSKPILCNYSETYTLSGPPLQFYVPVDSTSQCEH